MLKGTGGGSFPSPQPISYSILPTVASSMSRETTVEISAELLRTLHRIHRQLTDLRGQLERCPRQIKAGENFVAKAAADVDAVKTLQKKTKMAGDEKQLTLKTRENRVLELKVKLNSAASNKEFSLLKEQIAADEQANAVLSDEIFEVLENLDVLAGNLEEANAEELPVPDHSFDAAILTLILSVASDGAACMREAVRATRPGGRLLVFDKFLPPDTRPSFFRRTLNLLMRFFGTDINRSIEPMTAGLPVRVIANHSALLLGAYRTIVLQREGT